MEVGEGCASLILLSSPSLTLLSWCLHSHTRDFSRRLPSLPFYTPLHSLHGRAFLPHLTVSLLGRRVHGPSQHLGHLHTLARPFPLILRAPLTARLGPRILLVDGVHLNRLLPHLTFLGCISLVPAHDSRLSSHCTDTSPPCWVACPLHLLTLCWAPFVALHTVWGGNSHLSLLHWRSDVIVIYRCCTSGVR